MGPITTPPSHSDTLHSITQNNWLHGDPITMDLGRIVAMHHVIFWEPLAQEFHCEDQVHTTSTKAPQLCFGLEQAVESSEATGKLDLTTLNCGLHLWPCFWEEVNIARGSHMWPAEGPPWLFTVADSLDNVRLHLEFKKKYQQSRSSTHIL